MLRALERLSFRDKKIVFEKIHVRIMGIIGQAPVSPTDWDRFQEYNKSKMDSALRAVHAINSSGTYREDVIDQSPVVYCIMIKPRTIRAICALYLSQHEFLVEFSFKLMHFHKLDSRRYERLNSAEK